MEVLVNHFDQLTTADVYNIIKHRSAVFYLEQQCRCEDLDEKDHIAQHLRLVKAGQLVGYARIFKAGQIYKEATFGRVLVPKMFRGLGYGRLLTEHALKIIERHSPDTQIRISAQRYIEPLYSAFGFQSLGEYYDECGIEHIQMRKAGAATG